MKRLVEKLLPWCGALAVTACLWLPAPNQVAEAQTVEQTAALQLVSGAYTSATGLRETGASLVSVPGMAEAFFSQDVVASIKALSTSFDALTGRSVEGSVPVIEIFELRHSSNSSKNRPVIDAAVLSGGTVRLITFEVTSVSGGFKIADISGDGWTIGDKVAALSGGSTTEATAGSLFDQVGRSDGSAGAAPQTDAGIEKADEVAAIDREALIAQDGGDAGSGDAVPALALPFEDHFDSAELSEEWSVVNADDDAYVLENSNVLSIASGGGAALTNPEAKNVLKLNSLPDGDFDIMLDARLEARTGFDTIQLGLAASPEDAIILSFYTFTKGCGPSLYVDFASIRTVEGEDGPVTTSFNTDLFSKRWVPTICSSLAWGRSYGDAVIAELERSGFRLVLSRRDQFFTGRVEMTLPRTEDAEGGPVSYRTKSLARFDLPGPVSALIGQNRRAKGDTVGYIDRIAVVPAAPSDRVAGE